MEYIANIEEKISFRPHSLIKIDKYESFSKLKRSEKSDFNLIQTKEADYNGYLSPATKREITKRLEIWLHAIDLNNKISKSKKKVDIEQFLPTFVTLTLPSKQIHDDNLIKSVCLKEFISWATEPAGQTIKSGPNKGKQKSFGVEVYFWRAEVQKNGNIHFHILFDRYIPWERIREKWNQICNRLNYVDRYANVQKYFYRNGFKIRESQLKTDIKKFKGIAEKALKTKKIPDNCPVILSKYLEIAIKNDSQILPKIYEKLAEDHQKQIFEANKSINFSNPNSTDIHSIKGLKSITAYVVKYVTKATDLKPLAPGEVIREYDNQKYICRDHTQTWSDGSSKTYEAERRPYQAVFIDRRIHGRLWGCSDKINRVSNPEMKYFEKTLSERAVFLEEFNAKSYTGQNLRKETNPAILDDNLLEFYKQITEIIGKKTIAECSQKAGDSFAYMNGEIIPIRAEKFNSDNKYLRLDEVLKDMNPELFENYKLHYKQVFESIYGANTRNPEK